LLWAPDTQGFWNRGNTEKRRSSLNSKQNTQVTLTAWLNLSN